MTTPKALPVEKHTAGPWKAGRAWKQNNFGDCVALVHGTDDVGLLTIAKVFSGNGANNTAKVAEANARLIASAPTLLSFARAEAAKGNAEAAGMLASLHLSD